MANLVKVNKIEININGKMVELSLEEAKELKNILDDMFKEKIVKEYEYIPYYPYTYPTVITPHWTYKYTCYDYTTTGGGYGTATFSCNTKG